MPLCTLESYTFEFQKIATSVPVYKALELKIGYMVAKFLTKQHGCKVLVSGIAAIVQADR